MSPLHNTHPQPQHVTMPELSRIWIRLCSSCYDEGPPSTEIGFSKYLPHRQSRFAIFGDGCQALAQTMSALDILYMAPEHCDLAPDMTLFGIIKLVLVAYFLISFALGFWGLMHFRQFRAQCAEAKIQGAAEIQIMEKVVAILAECLPDAGDIARVAELLKEFVDLMMKRTLPQEQVPWQLGVWDVAVHPLVRLPAILFIAVPYLLRKIIHLP